MSIEDENGLEAGPRLVMSFIADITGWLESTGFAVVEDSEEYTTAVAESDGCGYIIEFDYSELVLRETAKGWSIEVKFRAVGEARNNDVFAVPIEGKAVFGFQEDLDVTCKVTAELEDQQ